MPEETLRQLGEISGIAPKEAILARALVRNGLAPPEKVLDAARATAADAEGNGVLQRLCSAGVLTQERALQIEKALEKRISGLRAAVASAPQPAPSDEAADPVEEAISVEESDPVGDAAASAKEGDSSPQAGPTAPKKRSPRMWQPRSKRGSDADESDASFQGVVSKRRGLREQESLDAFLEKYIRSRLHQLIMEKLTLMRAGVADPKALAKACGAKERDVVKVLKDWRLKGLLTTVHTFPYYYDPPPKLQETAELFMKSWRNEQEHNRLLMKILEYEG